jgi:hypothetical protein
MEDEYTDKLAAMREEYNTELKKKKDLDKELNIVREELEKIEYDYPKQIKDLKEQILSAKKKTEEYEDKTKALAEELRKMKAKKK